MTLTDRVGQAADTVVGWFNPRRAAIRAHFRRMANDPGYEELVLGLMRARGYRAAQSPEGSTGWLGGSRSADADLLNDLPKLRNRSRELNNDDPIASGLTGTFVNNIVGTGLRPRARTGDPKRDRLLEAVWSDRRDKLDPANGLLHAELQRLLFRKVREDGEVFVKASKRNADDPVWFEVVEADRVATPPGENARSKGGEIRDGVERDRWGVPVAYWIHKSHPGDMTLHSARPALDFERVEASAVCHLKTTLRPGQTRGVPMFHAILQDLRDLDLLMLASLKRVQIAACLSVFIKSNASSEDLMELTAQKYGYQMNQKIEPGMIFRLFPEEDISTLLPNFPTPELGPFIIMIARRIGAALGVSWQVVLKDFSDSTYSSARTDLLETRQVYVIAQQWFAGKALDWQWYQVQADARLRGDRRLAGVPDEQLRMIQWFNDGWRWIDPVKEANSIKIALQCGLTTLKREWIRAGIDPEDMVEELKEQAQMMKELGMIGFEGDFAPDEPEPTPAPTSKNPAPTATAAA